jgi:phosphonate transport system substrate-binding protein
MVSLSDFFKEIIMSRYKIIVFVLFLFTCLLFAYDFFQDFTDKQVILCNGRENKNKQKVLVGVVSRFAPPLIYRGYQPIMDYLTDNTNYNFELKLSESYENTIDDIVEGKIDIAFVGTFIYLQQYKKHNLIPVLAPKNRSGFPLSNVCIISSKNIKFDNLCSLKGGKIALPSEKSFASNWFISAYDSGCGSVKYVNLMNFNYHTSVIFQVLKGNYQFGVVKQNIADEFTNRGIFILYKSSSIPSSPVVVRDNGDKEMVNAFVSALLKLKKGDSILNSFDREFRFGFAKVSKEDYLKYKNQVLGVVIE